jgi:hypothetical protein
MCICGAVRSKVSKVLAQQKIDRQWLFEPKEQLPRREAHAAHARHLRARIRAASSMISSPSTFATDINPQFATPIGPQPL